MAVSFVWQIGPPLAIETENWPSATGSYMCCRVSARMANADALTSSHCFCLTPMATALSHRRGHRQVPASAVSRTGLADLAVLHPFGQLAVRWPSEMRCGHGKRDPTCALEQSL